MKRFRSIVGMGALVWIGLFFSSGHPSAQAAEIKKDFSDVSPSFWAYNEIMKMKEQGVVKGYEDGTFKPNNAIRRDHVAVLLARSLDLPVVEPAEKFKDVPSDYVYADAIRKVQQANIFDGTDGKFRPTEYLTRIVIGRKSMFARYTATASHSVQEDTSSRKKK
ncbi:hypothetical protein B6A27_08775 [Anoxybacillus sp. UARK-01]|uniref:S-layer homology domain-containing protein n=1 Tax=Anoxybacillus sp. UARK-01 TaxID=1895648 RepID=UPI0009BC12F8|nr:S-layer homology domain-containing protein [Anoxybacillus sp. UARK-01]OQM45981.1 hypothetical protein B6A27_08775 [Anoxybacillus sp. UARK-01]